MYCTCRGAIPNTSQDLLTLECLQCETHLVRCTRCRKVLWWTEPKRICALNAAEAHRWETDHLRVVVRNSAHLILREVEKPAAA